MKSFFKDVFLLITALFVATSGCSSGNDSNLPSDFVLIMDLSDANNDVAQNVNIRINADGRGEYERYSTGGVIQQDPDGMVVYEAGQIVDTGTFRLSKDELMQIWRTINDNHFFELDGNYEMAMGHSYAFIKVEANDQSHQVFNIGMEVPEIRAIVEVIQSLLPADVNVEYGKGFLPK